MLGGGTSQVNCQDQIGQLLKYYYNTSLSLESIDEKK